MDKDFQDRIDEYLLHEDSMTADERDSLLYELNTNEEKREQLEFTRRLKKAVDSREKKLGTINEFMQMEQEWREMELRKAGKVACACLCDASPAMPAAENVKQETFGKRFFGKKMTWAAAAAAVVLVAFLTYSPSVFENSGHMQDVRLNGMTPDDCSAYDKAHPNVTDSANVATPAHGADAMKGNNGQGEDSAMKEKMRLKNK